MTVNINQLVSCVLLMTKFLDFRDDDLAFIYNLRFEVVHGRSHVLQTNIATLASAVLCLSRI